MSLCLETQAAQGRCLVDVPLGGAHEARSVCLVDVPLGGANEGKGACLVGVRVCDEYWRHTPSVISADIVLSTNKVATQYVDLNTNMFTEF